MGVIDSSDYKDWIYVCVIYDCVMVEVEVVVEWVWVGEWLLFLDGVLVSWKDLFDIEGVVMELGLVLLKDCVLIEDVKVL